MGDEASPEAIEEVYEMISEAENQVYKTSKERMQRLIELNAMEIRHVEATNKSNRGLLRRYKREHEEGHSKQLLNQLETMQNALMAVEEDTTRSEMCFITLQSSFQETKDVLEAREEMLKMEGIPWEKFFGLIGIPVSHTVNNYTDPMNIGINEHLKEVVSSSKCSLNQKTLWSLSGTKDTKVNLDNLCKKTWGFKSKVTAVVPIKSWNDPTVWKAYHNGPLSKMVMSSQLRGAHTPMQQDEVAFASATLLRTVTDWKRPNKTQASLMADLLDTIQFTDPRRNGVIPTEITEFLQQTETHIITYMSSALAPMAKMLESEYVLRFAGSEESGHFWKAIVSNSIYWKVRRAMEGKSQDDVLRNLAGKSRDDIFRTLADFKNKSINNEELSKFQLDLTVFARMFKIAQRYKHIGKVEPSLFEDNQENIVEFTKLLTDSRFEMFMLTEVVRALICCGKITKKLKYPNFDSEERNWQWMKEELDRRDELGSDQVEAIEAWDNFLQEAPGQTLQQFAESLNDAIPNEFETIRGAVGKRQHMFKVENIYERLAKASTVQTVEKLKLILFGKASEGATWGNGEVLKNGQIAKKILDFLTPLLRNNVENTLDIKEYERVIEKTNQYTKHWYRKKGSRKGYTNQRPSFWAITTYTTPWAFLKKDRNGYQHFLHTLQKLDIDGDIARKTFYNEWQHLLRRDPTKKDCTARGQNLRKGTPASWENRKDLLLIFPEEKTFGLAGLMNTKDISAEDLQIEKEKLQNAAANIASNWESILQKMLPQEEAQKAAHSLKEVFGIDENSFKAFNMFQLLQEMPDIKQKRSALIKALVDASKTSNTDCLVETNIEDRTSEIYISDEQIKVLRENSLRILERLLPLRAVELTSSIEDLFREDEVRKMAAVCHVLHRYIGYGFTSMDALMKLLMDEKLINSTEEILVGGENFEVVHPAVSFELKYEIEGKKTEADIKRNLQDILDKFKNDENAILWMNLEYERTRKVCNRKPLKVTKEDLDTAKILVENAWYGGGLHEKVTVEFNYEEFNVCSEIAESQKERLEQLKEFFHLVLENVYQLVPIEAEFVKKGKTWKSSKKVHPAGTDTTTYEYWVSQDEKEVCDLLKGLMKKTTVLEETASIFNSLGAKGVKYNEAQKILDLLNDPNDVDNLTIKVQHIERRVDASVMSSGPIFVRPEKKTRFREIPEHTLTQIHQLMEKEMLTNRKLNNRLEDFFDILVNVEKSVQLFKVEERPEVVKKLNDYKSSPRTMIATFLKEIKKVNNTLGHLTDAFAEFKKEHSDDADYVNAMVALIEGMETVMKEARDLSEEQAVNQLAKDRSFKTFLNFLKDHPRDGMKKYAKAKGFTKDEFLKLANAKQIYPGDMIGFYRKKLGVEYTHAAIYAPVDEHQYVVHVQPQEGGGLVTRLKSGVKSSDVKCDVLEDKIANTDTVFYIRVCENRKAQAEVISKVEACLFEEPIKYTYNGYYGSCQTFCSKILGAELFEDINFEAFLTSATGMKAIAGWYLSDEANAGELIKLMDQRIRTRASYDVLEQNGDLMRTCLENSRFARHFG